MTERAAQDPHPLARTQRWRELDRAPTSLGILRQARESMLCAQAMASLISMAPGGDAPSISSGSMKNAKHLSLRNTSPRGPSRHQPAGPFRPADSGLCLADAG